MIFWWALDHPGLVAELNKTLAPLESQDAPGLAAYLLPSLTELYTTLDRVYQLAVSLPDFPLERYRQETAKLPASTEAERSVVQRVGQDIFRQALLDYWANRCPLTDITDTALLRASHIVPWAHCQSDNQRLDQWPIAFESLGCRF